MAKNNLLVNSLVLSAKFDLKKGIPRDVILRSLARVVERDLFNEVAKRL